MKFDPIWMVRLGGRDRARLVALVAAVTPLLGEGTALSAPTPPAAPACPIAKCVRYSGAPLTMGSDMLPNGQCYRVSLSSLGEV